MAFESLRQAALDNIVLAAPDFKRQFIMASDASEDGKGWVIYQLKDPNGKDNQANRDIIKYGSKAWERSMREGKVPPYYTEADAMITGALDAKYYAQATPFPLLILTDQAPLQWIKTCSKGRVTAWRIEQLWDIEYEVRYRPGSWNIVADALSRYPMLGPQLLARIGIESALESLCNSLTVNARTAKNLWAWAGKDTHLVSRALQKWRSPTNPIINRATKEAALLEKWDFAVVIPRPDRATADAARLLAGDRPVCILVPTDLVHYIPQLADGSFDTHLEKVVSEAKLLALTAPCMTWVCHKTGIERHNVFAIESATVPPGPAGLIEAGTLEEWIREQGVAIAKEATLISDALVQRDSGMYMILGKDNIARIYVPPKRRQILIKIHHEAIQHLSALKTYQSLRRNYDWPSMRKDVTKAYDKCEFCELSKARRNQSSGTWRAVKSRPPRSRWGMDWYGVGDGHVLGMMDLDSLYVELGYSPHRTAEATRNLFEFSVTNRHGPPSELRSDHAREFVGKIMAQCKAEHGYKHTTTGGYNASGSSTMERFWGYLRNCILLLTDEQYEEIPRHLQQMAYAWNTTVSESLGVSPFEVMTGVTPRSRVGMRMHHEGSDDMNIASIRVAAAEYSRVAAANADFNRKRNAEHLNSFGRKLRTLKVGDLVKIYAPPSAQEARRRKRKVKHLFQWKGPMRIIAIKGSMMDLVSVANPDKHYSRNITNVRVWKGDEPKHTLMEESSTTAEQPTKESSEEQQTIAGTSDDVKIEPVELNELLFIYDTDTKCVDLVRVTEVTDKMIIVRCYGTQTKNLNSAKLTPVSVDKFGRTLLHKPRHSDKAAPLIWEIDNEDIPGLVKGRNLKLCRNGTMTAATKKALRSIRPKIELHRY